MDQGTRTWSNPRSNSNPNIQPFSRNGYSNSRSSYNGNRPQQYSARRFVPNWVERNALTEREEQRVKDTLLEWVLDGRVADDNMRHLMEDGLGGRPLGGLDFEDYTHDEVQMMHKFQSLVDEGNYAETVLCRERNIRHFDLENILGQRNAPGEKSNGSTGYKSLTVFFF